jgi:hypothetical protein
MEDDESRPPLAGLIVLFIGAAIVVVGVAFLTFGLYSLIRTGVWPHYPFSKMLTEIGVPASELPGGGLGWVFAQSACVVLLAVGTLFAVLGVWLIARFNRRRRQLAEAAEAAA